MKINLKGLKLNLYWKKISSWVINFLQTQPLRFLIFLTLAIFIYATVVFYLCAFKSRPEIQITSNLQIKTDLAQRVISKLKQRDANIQQAMGEHWRDIFR